MSIPFKTKYRIAKALIPRKCFVCGEKGGWGKKNVWAIYMSGFHWGTFWEHFHPHCLKDAICCPGDYDNEVVNTAVEVFNKWEALQLKDRMDRKGKELDLKKAQQEICKGR